MWSEEAAGHNRVNTKGSAVWSGKGSWLQCGVKGVAGKTRVGQNHIYTVNTVFLAGKSPKIRSYTVHIYGYGQP